MDQKSWLWKKRSTEKTLVTEKVNSSLSRNEDLSELPELMAEKAELQRDLKILNERLSTALAECNAKDSIAQKQVKIAQEAITGWEKAEEEAIYLKKELDKVLQQKAACEERLSHLDGALKECMQQLRFVQEEQERRVHGAVVKTSEEFEKTRISLDEKLAEASKRLAKLDAENTVLRKALSGKDKAIEDLSKTRVKIEADFNAFMGRVESTEKENASLKYEIRVLEKELDIRNEEREFTRRTADVAQKQQQESNKRVAKLESECQRLRLLVRKRLPGPAALTKMKNEVEILTRDQTEPRRRSNPSLVSSMDFHADGRPDSPNRKINFLNEQLHAMEEENQILKEAIIKKSNELQFPKTVYPRAASPLSRAGGQFEESLKGQTTRDPEKYMYLMRENSVATSSDMLSDDKESWASALISELEHFKNEKQLRTPSRRSMETPDMNLMDDFAEMEKLAVVSVDYPAGSSHHSSDEGNVAVGHTGSPSAMTSSPLHGVPGPLEVMMKMVLEHSQVSQRDPNEVLEELRVSLARNGTKATYFSREGSIDHPEANGNYQTPPKNSLDVTDTIIGNNTASKEKTIQKVQSNVAVSIHKILELLEGVNIITLDGADTGYVARVFQWKTVELSAILQQFIQTCNDLLGGKADLEQFAEQVASNLDWVMNHCFSLQDVSSMKDAIRNNLDWDESESEVESGSANQSAESNRLRILREDTMHLPMASPLSQTEVLEPNTKGQILDLQLQPQSENAKIESLELEMKKQAKGKTVDQTEKQKMMKEDLVAQLTETNLKILQLENELENKNNSCRRLEEACNDLKIQLNRVSSKQVPDDGKQWEEQLPDDWEITAASEKLAECQETILNLGKQLKALASPRDAALFDSVISTPADTTALSMPTPERSSFNRSSLLDKMIAEDNNKTGGFPGTKDDDGKGNSHSGVSTNVGEKLMYPKDTNREANKISPPSMAIIPGKKTGSRSFLKKLFSRRRKVGSKKTSFS